MSNEEKPQKKQRITGLNVYNTSPMALLLDKYHGIHHDVNCNVDENMADEEHAILFDGLQSIRKEIPIGDLESTKETTSYTFPPRILVTPPPLERTLRYASCTRGTPYPKKHPDKFSKDKITKPKKSLFNQRRLFKRRNAIISKDDLIFLRNAGKLCMQQLNEDELSDPNSPKKSKKHVTFTNSTPAFCDQNPDGNITAMLDQITSSCIELAKQLNCTNTQQETVADTSNLATNFENACSISANVDPISSEVCTELFAAPSAESANICATPALTTNTLFACQSPIPMPFT